MWKWGNLVQMGGNFSHCWKSLLGERRNDNYRIIRNNCNLVDSSAGGQAGLQAELRENGCSSQEEGGGINASSLQLRARKIPTDFSQASTILQPQGGNFSLLFCSSSIAWSCSGCQRNTSQISSTCGTYPCGRFISSPWSSWPASSCSGSSRCPGLPSSFPWW